MESKRDPEVKSLDAVMESAFYAGIAHGMAKAGATLLLPVDEEAYRLWRDRWTGLPHEPQEDATGEGRWVRAAACGIVHRYGAEGWRPAGLDGVHEHWVVNHRFDPGITGMSSMCNELVIRDGDTDECNLPRWQHG